jgi:hypothetical protein
MGPYSKVDYSHIIPEADMVIKKAFSGDSPPRQGAGKSFRTFLISHRRRRWLAVCFVEINRAFRFSSPRRIYRRKGGIRKGARGATPPGGAARG